MTIELPPSGTWGDPAPIDATAHPDTAHPEAACAPTAHPVEPTAGHVRHRRRFAAAVSAALVLGAGTGALATAVATGGHSTTVVRSAAADATSDTGTIQGLVAKVEPALVDIETTGTSESSSTFGNGLDPFGGQSTEETAAAGTGMIISSDGLILTNAHVLEGADTIKVVYAGQTAEHTATLVGEDAAKDVALIQVAGASGLPTVTLGSSSGAQVGDSVLAIGNALNLQTGGFTVSSGIISALGRSISTDNGESLAGLLQTSAAISSGDSGGALVDSTGEVIGMNTASASSSGTNTASNIGFSIPTSEIEALIPRLEKGSIGTTTVGTGSSGDSGASGSYGSGGDASGGGGSSDGGSGGDGSGGYAGSPWGSYGGY